MSRFSLLFIFGVVYCWWHGFKFLHDALCIDASFIQRAQSSFVIVVVTCESGCLSFEYQGLGIPRNCSEVASVFGRDCLLPTFGVFWVTSWFVVHGWVRKIYDLRFTIYEVRLIGGC